MKHFTTICFFFLLTAPLSASLMGQGVGRHDPISVNTKIPGFKRGFAAVSSSRAQRYKRILSQSQNTWNTEDNAAYIHFWNGLTENKRKLVRSNAQKFHQGTAYLAFITKPAKTPFHQKKTFFS